MFPFIRRAAILFACFSCCAAPQDTPVDPAVQIPPLLQAGDASFLHGDYEAARQSFDQAWQLAQQTPPGNPARYDVLKRLTSVRAAAGEFADADNYLQQAINWRETVLGPNDPKIADDLLISVNLCRGMKDYERALVVLRRVMGMHLAASSFDSAPVADDFSRMAQIYMEQKKPENAVGALTAALGIRTKLAGQLHPSLVPDLDRLGEVYITGRAYDKAEAVYRHSLAIREILYGKEHADLIATVDGLAYALFGQEKYDEAEPVYQRLLALWVKSVGADHPMVAVALDKVAIFYAKQKKYDQTRDALERSNAIRAHFLATGLSQQATEEFEEHKTDQAKALYQRALALLDPSTDVNQELRAEIESILKSFEAPTPKPQPKKAPPKIAPQPSGKKP